MNTVSIFLASSIREFEKDRLDITSFVYQINRLYKNQLKINLEICEHQSNAMSIGGNQDEYNDIIRRCDYFYLLAGNRIGQYIEEEFHVAREQFERTKKQPKIYTYFEQVDAPDESLTRFRQMLWDKYDYFTPDYTNIDTIKLNIILELMRDGYIDSEVQFADGNVTEVGEKLMDMDNIPNDVNECRDFFISACDCDDENAIWIADLLKQNGFSVFYCKNDCHAGMSFVSWINYAMRRSKSFLAVISEAYEESNYCMLELNAAINICQNNNQYEILPVRVENKLITNLLIQPMVRIDIFSDDKNKNKKVLLEAANQWKRRH